ncbi:MAG: hypothetical protein SFU56_07435 [Capsulimonadales bacterium]|nr:hypothetical protein [Capsulimonadales bacterium]
MEKQKNFEVSRNRPVSDDPYSNDFPITGPKDDRWVERDYTLIGMADIDNEETKSDGVDLLTETETLEGAGMKDGGLVGSRSFTR